MHICMFMCMYVHMLYMYIYEIYVYMHIFIYTYSLYIYRYRYSLEVFPGGSDGNPSATWETWVSSLGQEDPLEKGMAIHSTILAWRTPRTEEPGGLQAMGSPRVGHT